MANFNKTIATAKAKVADAETKAFIARLEAIEAILEDAHPDDVLLLCTNALAEIVPRDQHLEEFKEEFLQALGECIAMRQDTDEPADDSDAHRSMH